MTYVMLILVNLAWDFEYYAINCFTWAQRDFFYLKKKSTFLFYFLFILIITIHIYIYLYANLS